MPKTVALFSLNHLPGNKELADMAPPGLFSEAGYAGIGFSIGCGVNINVARTRLPGTLVGRLADVPVVRARRIDLDGEIGRALPQHTPKHALGGR